MHQQSLAQRIFQKSNIRGQFRLRSGMTSEEYFDKYLFESDPLMLREIAEAMAPLIPQDTEAIAGLEMGGIPIATVLSQLTGIPTLFVRKAPKDYGTCKLVEGGEIEERKLVIVEDVVSTGGQIIESANALCAAGASIVGVICVIDRETGGFENLANAGFALHSLLTMTELKREQA